MELDKKFCLFLLLLLYITNAHAQSEIFNCDGDTCIVCIKQDFATGIKTVKGCIRIRFQPETMSVVMDVIMDGVPVVETVEIAGPKDIPICTESMPALCIAASKVRFEKDYSKICLDVSLRAGPITLANIPLPCLEYSHGTAKATPINEMFKWINRQVTNLFKKS